MDTVQAQLPQNLVIVPSGAGTSTQARPGHTIVEVLSDPQALITTPRPEHVGVRQSLKRLGAQARQLADTMDAGMHPEVAGANFWADFAGWFAMFSLGPLLATDQVLRDVVAEHRWHSARILENARDLGWWAGKTHLLPVAAGVLDAAGIPWSSRPGKLLHWLRALLMPAGGRIIGTRELNGQVREAERAAIGADPTIRPCDLLFAGVGAATASIIANLWHPLTETHGLRCAVLDYHYDGFTRAIERQELPRHDIGQFSTESDVRAAKSMAARWPTWYRHFAANVESVAEFQTLSDGLKAAIAERVRMSLVRHTPEWLWRSAAGRRALEQLRPKVLVTFHTYTPTTASLVNQARDRGIRTILLQHGVISDWYYVAAAQRFDEALVWGSESEQMHGWLLPPETKITQTGNSLYDGAMAIQGGSSEELAALRQDSKTLVVLATQPNEHLFYDDYASWWIGAVAAACEELDARLILKLHPADANHRLYEQAVQAHPRTVAISEHGQYPLTELLAACDAMITRDSTVVFEANLVGVPAVTINLTGRDDWFPYADLGGAVGIYRRDDIIPQLRRVLYDGEFRRQIARRRAEFLAAQVGPTDGKATERIVDVLAGYAAGES